MNKYAPEELQQMAKVALANTGTMEFRALLELVSFLSGVSYQEAVRRIENLAKCGKEECE